MNHLNYYWIAFSLTVPALLGVLAAWPFWRKAQNTFGSIIGTVFIFGSAIGLILREYVELDRSVQKCLEDGVPCFPHPEAFTRFALYASIALVQVMLLFTASLIYEKRMNNRDYDPEWR